MYIFILLAIVGSIYAQDSYESRTKIEKGQTRKAQRKFQILVENERDVKQVENKTERLLRFQDSVRNGKDRSLIAGLLLSGLGSTIRDKTVKASQNVVNLVTESLRSKRKDWYRKAKQQCYYKQSLTAESKIDDFYALPSSNGALDPANIKFAGFGCKNYIEIVDEANEKEGVGIFYIFCKLRLDSLGLNHIVNHSKFLVEIDSLVFNPKYCNLPNDSTGNPDSRFCFDKRDNLVLQLKARFYSSWINQAIMIADNQLLGEFTINIKVDKSKLNSEGLFVYKNNDEYNELVTVNGDCFIVPRSYTGTNDGTTYSNSWGTGQYRVEMDVIEQCSIVDSYYQKPIIGKKHAVVLTNKDDKDKDGIPYRLDKKKWKVEWNAMKKRGKRSSFFKSAWNSIVSAYKGTGWMATLTDPVTTALYTWEAKKIDNWINEISPITSTQQGSIYTGSGKTK